MKRPMIVIDENKCDGCGLCVTSCAEGALEVIDGVATLVSDKYCDGLGACLADCPQDALTVEDREADPFDEEAVERHLASKQALLKQWPVKLMLLHPLADYLQGADLVLAADCVGFAHQGFHDALLKGRPFGIACPKLDEPQRTIDKIATLAQVSGLKSITILRMEVPCCGGLEMLARAGLEKAGVDIPVKSEVIEIGPAFGGRGAMPMGGGCPSSAPGMVRD